MSYPPPNPYSSYPPPPGSTGATSQAYPGYGAPPGPQAQPRGPPQYPYASSTGGYPQPGSQPYQAPPQAPVSLPYPGQMSAGPPSANARPAYPSHMASSPVTQVPMGPPSSSGPRPPFAGSAPSFQVPPPPVSSPGALGNGYPGQPAPPPPSYPKATSSLPYPGAPPQAPVPAATPASYQAPPPPMFHAYGSSGSGSSSGPPPSGPAAPTPASMSMPPPPMMGNQMSMPPPPTSLGQQQAYNPYGGMGMNSGMPPPPPAYGAPTGYPGVNTGAPPAPGGYDPRMGGPAPRAPQTPSNRVDPAQIPRPVEGQELVTYRTVANGDKAPPAVSRPFVAIDDGNCSPRYLRATTYYLPQTREAAALAKLPLSLICRPMAAPADGEEEVPVVDYGDMGPVRCSRCKAYINTFVNFLDHGAKWSCNICGLINDTPDTYQCGIDQYGKRRDAAARPEFSRGSVEFRVGKDYCVRPPQEPIYIFAVDVSPAAVASGMMRGAIDAISHCLDHLPGGDGARMGVVTFSSKVQFYRLPSVDNGEVPSVILLGDVDDPFSALPPDRWVIQDKGRFRALLQQIPDLSAASGVREESASVATIEAAADALETLGGRIFVFTSSRPTKGAGALRLRTDPRDYGTERERNLYTPMDGTARREDKAVADYYYRLADVCAARQISIELFVNGEANEFVDAATLGKLTHTTAGKLHLYKGAVSSPATSLKFAMDVRRALTKRVANETVLKVRTGIGLTFKRYLSPGVERMPGELELSTVDPDMAFIAEFVHDGERIKDGDRAYFQLALLYTSPEGHRLVRVHNLALPVTTQTSSIFRYADLEAVFTHVVKASCVEALSDPLVSVRESVTRQCVDALYQYRLTCASSSPPGQLILPESLKLMPLYTLAFLKSDALRLNPPEAGRAHGSPDPTGDERAVALLYLAGAPEFDILQLLYPRLYQVHGLHAPLYPSADSNNGGGEGPIKGGVEVRRLTSPSSEFLALGEVFVLDTWTALYLYVSREVPVETLRELFGIDSLPAESHTGAFTPSLADGGDKGRALSDALEEIRKGRSVYPPVVVVMAGSGSAVESHFTKLLVDDRTKIDQSYVEYLCTVHKQIQNRLQK